MSSNPPFSLRIFVSDGDPDGLRIVERSNWVGKAVIFPRPLLPTIKQRTEFQQTGVYLLVGPKPDGDGEILYIGEGDPIKPRLESHFANKDFWTRAVCFVAAPGQLNKAHVQFLEAALIALAKEAKRMPLDNANTPTEPSLSEADRADMLVFLTNMLGMLPVLGVHAFEKAAPMTTVAANVLLYCKGKGVTATGYESSQGFVVKAGSQAAATTTPSMKQHLPAVCELRHELIANGVLVLAESNSAAGYRFTQDSVFSSPSTAADVVLGRSANGRTEWRDADGVTLRERQEKAAAQ